MTSTRGAVGAGRNVHAYPPAESAGTRRGAASWNSGAQWRLDYPEKLDDTWGKVNLVAFDNGGQVKIEQRPLSPMPPELQALIEKYK